MAYSWAQLGFVERWRMNAVRGQVVGMYRPDDRTLFDLRLRPGEGNVGQIQGVVELRLVDAGDIIRAKRIALLDRMPVIVRVVASSIEPAEGPATLSASGEAAGQQRRRLQAGAVARGQVVEVEGTTAVVNVGLPVVVEASGAGAELQPGRSIKFTVEEIPKGFFVI
jgi:hypothetical protein